MSRRARFYIALVPSLIAVFAMLKIGEEWSEVTTYAAVAGFVALSTMPMLVWVHMAPDGDLRRPRR